MIEEADEALYWMEMLLDAELIPEQKLGELMLEANEIITIMTETSKTTRKNKSRK